MIFHLEKKIRPKTEKMTVLLSLIALHDKIYFYVDTHTHTGQFGIMVRAFTHDK